MRLFRARKEFFPGIFLEVSKQHVCQGEWNALERGLDALATYVVSSGRRFYVELVFSGFDSDPRPIDLVPEVKQWSKMVEKEMPDLTFWLTPGALIRHWLALGPKYANRLANQSYELGTELGEQAARSAAFAHSRLKRAGMQPERIMALVAEGLRSIDAVRQGKIEVGKHYTIGLPD